MRKATPAPRATNPVLVFFFEEKKNIEKKNCKIKNPHPPVIRKATPAPKATSPVRTRARKWVAAKAQGRHEMMPPTHTKETNIRNCLFSLSNVRPPVIKYFSVSL